MATINKPIAHTWLIVLSVGVFSLGIMGGFLQSAEGVARDFSYAVVPHQVGRVAGAEVSVGPGSVTIQVEGLSQPATYLVDIDGPTSIYNLLRLAVRVSSLRLETVATQSGFSILSVNGVTMTGNRAWQISQDGSMEEDLNSPIVVPGDVITISQPR